MTVEIFIDNIQMDLPENPRTLHFPVTYSLADLKNPEKRKRNFSKTIKLPATQKNNQFFESAYDLGRIDTDGSGFGFDFDPTLRYTCRVSRNGQTVFAGTVNLESVDMLNQKPRFYNITLYSAMTNIYQELGDITISELGWDEYDHTLNITNIQNSWTAAPGSGYWYPYIDYGFSDDPLAINTNHLRPFVYFAEIMEKCFEKAGFNLSSSFISSAFFSKFALGYGGGDPIDLDAAEVADRRANYTGDGTKNAGTLFANKFEGIESWGYIYNVPFPIKEPDMTLTLVTDTKGQFDTDSGELVIANSGNYNIAASANVDLNYAVLPLPFTTYSLFFTVRLQIFKNYALISDTKQEHFDTGNGSTTLSFSVNQKIDADPGDVITARIFAGTAGSLSNNPGAIQFDLDLNNTLTYDLTAINSGLVDGDLVEIARHLPKMKCKDFLNDMTTFFNLYTDDPDQDLNVRVEPFDSFFTETDDYDDWSDKVNHKQMSNIKPANTIEGKSYAFHFAQDRDYYKERYFKQYGIDYGDFVYDVPSTFKKGVKKYQSKIAQSVPVQIQGTDIIIPRIIKYDEGTGVTSPHKGKPRAFINNGVIVSDDWQLINSDTGAPTTFGSYPQAHHLDDLTTADFDFNFGRPEVVYYAATTYTTDNLFYRYNARLIRELTSRDSKIFNAFFNLIETDLKQGFMRRLVNIDGVLYRKNMVKDFLVTVRKTTKVELIRIVESFSKKDYQDAMPEIPALPIDGFSDTVDHGDSPYIPQNNKSFVPVDTTGGDVDIHLDGSYLQKGKRIEFFKTDVDNFMTFIPQGGALINGQTSISIKTKNAAVAVRWDGDRNFYLTT